MQRSALILFVRYPQPGMVKTRLAAAIGDNEAAELYKSILLDLFSELSDIDADLKIFISDSKDKKRFENMFKLEEKIYSQAGNNIGERMADAFERIFNEDYSYIALIGSDIPGLSKGIVLNSFAELKSSDSVIGPAVDGGYYLIGFKKRSFTPGIFQNIEWSTSTVFSDSSRYLKEKNISFSVIELRRDMDSVEDLNFFTTGSNMDIAGKSTKKILERISERLK